MLTVNEQPAAPEGASAGLTPTRRTVVKTAWFAPVVVGVAAAPAAAGSPPQETTTVVVQLLDSNSNGLAGGIVTYYYQGAWHNGGTTGSDGTAAVVIAGTTGAITFAIKYLGATQQLATQDLATTSTVEFLTVPVTLQLLDHEGDPLSAGSATFYAGSWQTFGTTGQNGSVTKELLPVKHSFAMTYLGSRQQVEIDPVSTTPVVFQTGLLTSSDQSVSQFWTTTWQNFPPGGVELLPSVVTIRPVTGPDFTVTPTPGQITDLTA